MSEDYLDLDALELAAEPWVLRFRGERFDMPGDMAAEALVAFGRYAGAQRRAQGRPDEEASLIRLESFEHLDRLTALLFASDEDYARFKALRPTESQRQALVLEAIRRSGGGQEPGEASDSQRPSHGTGRPASPTSLASTG